jgi:hypothetical protein
MACLKDYSGLKKTKVSYFVRCHKRSTFTNHLHVSVEIHCYSNRSGKQKINYKQTNKQINGKSN